MQTQSARLSLQVERELFTSDEIPDVLFDLGGLHDAHQEVCWTVAYDSAMQVRTIVEVARGGYHSVEISIPAVLTAVLTAGTDRFLIAHNHWIGDVAPTEPDVDLTAKVMAAANACGLHFEDHLILGPQAEVFSFADHGFIIPSTQLVAMGRTNRKARLP